MMALVEWSWNVFPATALSSGVLAGCHALLLLLLLVQTRLEKPTSETQEDAEEAAAEDEKGKRQTSSRAGLALKDKPE